MEATAVLSSEHRVIELVIAVLDAAADRVDAGAPVRPALFADAVRFLRDFADGYHHGKEEEVLFTAMAAHGLPFDDGPIGVMRYEHDRGRDITRKLDAAARRLAAGDTTAAGDAAHYARQYGELLAMHIHKEDQVLFPMAGRLLAETEQAAALEAFHAVELAQAHRGPKEALVALARALAVEMGVDENAPPRRGVEVDCDARCC